MRARHLKSEVVCTKATPEQKDRWDRAALARGLRVSQWLREIAERETLGENHPSPNSMSSR
jgi:hypothetical protein